MDRNPIAEAATVSLRTRARQGRVSLHDATRTRGRWSAGRFGAAGAAAVVAGALYAATAGLPFTETFDDAALKDAAATTADWGETMPGMLTFPSAVPLADPFTPASTAVDLPGDPQITRALQLGDMNGDGFPDIVQGVSGVSGVFLNDGAGNFAARSPITTDSANTRGIAVGDVNGDGFLDVVTGNLNSAPARLYLNAGDGVTFTGSDITPAPLPIDSIVLADFNADGHLDVAVALNGVSRQPIYLNTGDAAAPFGATGVAGQNVSNSGWDAQEVLAGDINNDGSVDLVYMTQNGVNIWCVNDGAASFACHAVGADADNSQSGALADVNGDGFLDVVVGNYGTSSIPQSVKIYLNSADPADSFGGATAIEATAVNDPTGVHRVQVADLDDDGDVDILLATSASTSVDDAPPTTNRILLNDGTGQSWTMVPLGAETDVSVSIAVGDLNGDAKPDIVVGNEARDPQFNALPLADRVYLNAGTATSAAPVQQLAARAASVRVDTETSNIAGIALTADPPSPGPGNRVDFWVSSNGGTNWLHVVPDGTTRAFPEAMQGQDLRWRADLSSLSPAAAKSFALDTVTLSLTASGGAGGGGENTAPSFTSMAVTAATVGTAYSYTATATDPDAGDTLALSATSMLPAWLALTDNGDGTATLAGTPTAADVGEVPVDLQAKDAGGATATQSFTITVAAAPASGTGGSPSPPPQSPPSSSGGSGGGGGSLLGELAFLLALAVIRLRGTGRRGPRA
ncbi:MAG TPA: FG-GAP-like repeat-containing protein [Gammaproteobacteria bacterium]|nr:FG-GAP-like repeat-containing protein [Gammaproteobacteria bacterium]